MKYTLMNKNTPIVSLDIDEQTLYIKEIDDIYNSEYKPYGIKNLNKKQITDWLLARKIPASRDNIDDILDNLKISSTNELVFKAFGLSLSDQYWLKPNDSNINWKDINFFDNDFSDDMGKFLFEDYKDISSLKTPDNTSNGDLKKSWKIINNKRVLLKAGRPPYNQEPFNEVLASEICKRLDFDYIEYKSYIINGKYYSGSENFISKNTELVSAWDLIKDRQKPNHMNYYDFYLDISKELGLDVKKEVDDMIVLDYIINNEDRHFRNFGLIRNVETLEFEKAAPIFDSGYSMYCQQTDNLIGKYNKSKPFREHHDKQIELVDLSKYDFTKLKDINEYAYELYSKNYIMEDISSRRKMLLSKDLDNKIRKLEKLQQKSIKADKKRTR